MTVEGDVVLAGALGSVGQKVVAKQASKVTAEFAENLQLALSGAMPGATGPLGSPSPAGSLLRPAPAAPGGRRGEVDAVAPGHLARRGDRA